MRGISTGHSFKLAALKHFTLVILQLSFGKEQALFCTAQTPLLNTVKQEHLKCTKRVTVRSLFSLHIALLEPSLGGAMARAQLRGKYVPLYRIGGMGKQKLGAVYLSILLF